MADEDVILSSDGRCRRRMRRLWLFAAGGLTMLLLLLLFAIMTPSVPEIPIGPTRVKPQMAVNADRVLVLVPDGSLWAWGQGMRPQRLGTETDWKAIALSGSYFVALKTNGSLWQWMDAGGFSAAPQKLSAANSWQAVAAGYTDFVALRTDGTLWTWQGPPVQLDESTNWVSVAAGFQYMAGVRGDGTLWAWGQFYPPSGPPRGMTQVGSETNWVTVHAGSYELMARKRDGSCWMGGGTSTPWLTNLLALQRPLQWGEMARIKEIEDWDSVTFGSCALGLRSDGTLQGFGMNWAGILGRGLSRVRKGPLQIGPRHDWVAIGAGGWVAAGMTADGTVWAWGKRVDKQGRWLKAKQIAAEWLTKLGLKVNTTLISPSPSPILRFRLQKQTDGAHRKVPASATVPIQHRRPALARGNWLVGMGGRWFDSHGWNEATITSYCICKIAA